MLFLRNICNNFNEENRMPLSNFPVVRKELDFSCDTHQTFWKSLIGLVSIDCEHMTSTVQHRMDRKDFCSCVHSESWFWSLKAVSGAQFMPNKFSSFGDKLQSVVQRTQRKLILNEQRDWNRIFETFDPSMVSIIMTAGQQLIWH